jgi:hypothetical protein
MTDTMNGQTTHEPETFTRVRPEPPGYVKSWRKYRAKPGWQQVMLGLGVVGAVGYGSWRFVAGPVIENRVAVAVDAEFARSSEAFAAGVLQRSHDDVAQQVAQIQQGIDPVVIKTDPLAWLPCLLNADAKNLIGAAPAPAAAGTMDPTRASQVETAVREKIAQGVKLTDMRLTSAGGLRIVVDLSGTPLVDCTAATQAAPAPAAATPTTAPAATPVTPPPNAN